MNHLKANDYDDAGIDLDNWEPEDFEKYCQLLNFRLITTKQSYGPFGSSDTTSRKKIEIPIDSNDITSQVTKDFIYCNKHFTNKKWITFHVSLNYQRTRIIKFFSRKSKFP